MALGCQAKTIKGGCRKLNQLTLTIQMGDATTIATFCSLRHAALWLKAHAVAREPLAKPKPMRIKPPDSNGAHFAEDRYAHIARQAAKAKRNKTPLTLLEAGLIKKV